MAPQSTTVSTSKDEKQTDGCDPKRQEALMAGRKLANPPPGEEILITGMAGSFPDAHNVDHFKHNLLNKIDMISSDERRWKHEHPEIPVRGGKVFGVEKFDPGFFGIHQYHIQSTDPMCRILLERVYEAIIDAGYHPSEFEGTRTGVYVGVCLSETENIVLMVNMKEGNSAMSGCTRSMQANRISYWLKLKGPSFVTDTACSSSLYSFEQAFRDLREDRCETAIVCGANLCLNPYVSLQFARLGVLSMDGRCKSFDNNADGYARSEGIAVVILQKAKNARRNYAKVIHAKTNCDGFKEQGITYPSGEAQKALLEDFYQECQVAPSSLSYMEAHGTGTKVGDPEELTTLDEVFCPNRDSPLLIGSVKSNIGHNEPVSGLCSVVKVVLGMENDVILPNINFKTIREGVEGLETKRMIVVSEKTPWPDNRGLAGINSFGFGGGNSHILLKWNEKLKVNKGVPKDDLPRLVCVSGRVKNSSLPLFEEVTKTAIDAEFIALMHHSFRKSMPGHQYRGFCIVNKFGEIMKSEKHHDEINRPLVYLFGAPDKKWATIGHQLFAIPAFAGTIQKIHEVYAKNGLPVNVTEIINSYKADNLAHYIIGSVSVQLALVDILKEVEGKPSKTLGYSLGSISAKYCDGSLTLDEAVLASYYTTLTFTEILEKKELKPEDVSNSKTGQHLLRYLKQVIDEPKDRYPRKSSENSKTLPEELTEKILTYTNEHIQKDIPKNSVLLEIGANAVQMKPVETAKNKKKLYANVDLVQIGEKDAVVSLLEGIGRLYEQGFDFNLYELYPKVQFPVSKATPMLSHLVKWNHEQSWYVIDHKEWVDQFCGFKMISPTIKDIEWSYLTGHVIDGRNLFPATGYLCCIWNLFATMLKKMIGECRVVFENVRFVRAVNIPKNGSFNLMLTIQRCSGKFEVVEGDVAVVTGNIFELENDHELDLTNSEIEAGVEEMEIPLSDKDIYKELRLRGYNYSGMFRGVKKVEKHLKVGYIEWKNNYTAFMDNMLQMKILQEDTRNLYVPTAINRIVIDPKGHMQKIEELGENPVIPVYVNNHTGVIRSDFIEIRGLYASPIPRRKPMGEPVLETYKFVPNVTALSIEESTRVNVQIALENIMSVKVKAVEVAIDNIPEDYVYLAPLILNVLGDLPLMQPEVSILSSKELEITNVTVEDKELKGESDCLLVIVQNLSQNAILAVEVLSALRDDGFVISRESLESEVSFPPSLDLYTVHTTETEKLYMLRKKPSQKKENIIIEIPKDHRNFDWLPSVQNAVKQENDVLIVSQKDKNSGILGFVNCIRREPQGEKVRAVFIQDEDGPDFESTKELFASHLEKGFAMNIYKDGQWGTYRHVLLSENPLVDVQHSFAIVGTPGDLSTLKWIEGPLTVDSKLDVGGEIVHIYYASLNFRDIMTASGRISVDVITRDRTQQLCVQGFEFSGRSSKGKRVFGMVTSGALASIASSDIYMNFPVPDEWTLQDAATVPCVYCTVLIALIRTGKIKYGESILIHAGTGGIGQAAINIATYYGCTIFTTVGTKEKREFIRKQFPHVRDTHIGNSRDTSFEQMVMYHTKGKGVDLVLNSLSEEKLQASVRCLARGGRFLEIGKFDLASNNSLALKIFEKEASFHSVMLDLTMTMDPHIKLDLVSLLTEGIKNGSVKPLQRTIFKQDEIESAFRFMASGKHMGKVMLRVREEENETGALSAKCLSFKAEPRYYCDPEKSVIIIGGLGGFGLELADWLMLRQVKNLVLTSRKGITTGYQAMRIKNWKSYGVNVVVATEDVTKKEDCVKLLEKANALGSVQAIFNLGVVLRDSILENQTAEDFTTSFAPKAYATEYLDELSRKMCPDLRDFVIFSSVSCGRGNPGQTNYGMANSIMERICENRKKDGYPALAIEWGAVGDVGLVAEMQESNTEIVIGGTLQQRISSCLNVMDTFLRQSEPIVSSMVVAEKRSAGGSFDNAIDAVANILGLRDIKIVSPHSTLPELGMDSIMAVEIKQILESEYEIVLTPQEIRSMTFARIQEMEKEKESGEGKKKEAQQAAVNTFKLFLVNVGPANQEIATKPFIQLKTKAEDIDTAPKVILIPGVEGYATIFEGLAENTDMNLLSLQYMFDRTDQNIISLAKRLLPVAKDLIGTSKQFNIMGYSFGVSVTLELIHLLEAEGYSGKAVFIDGAPDLMKEMCQKNFNYESDALFETTVLCGVLSVYMPNSVIEEVKMKMILCKSYEERIQVGLEFVPEDFLYPHEFLLEMTRGFYERCKAVLDYEKSFDKINAPVKLIKPKISVLREFHEDYKLNDYCTNLQDIHVVEGNHITVLANPEVASLMQSFFTDN